ncbi:MAG: MMPL family transporter [Treponema sp.]|nr:MMPL family transporter [Treponema sp.]
MKVSTINHFFGKIGRLQIQWRVPILCVFILLTLFCCLGLTKFEIQNSSEGWYGEGDILKQNKDTYEAIFGNRNNAAVLVVADDVFSQEILEVIDRLGQRMITEIPYANKLTSLIELDIPLGTEEGYNIIKPYENGIPSDKAELQAKRNLILRGTEHTNACKNVLVSDDGTETWICLTLFPFDEPDTFKDPEKMAAVQEFETFLGTLSMTKTSGTKPRVSSVTDILKEMNRALNKGQDEFYTVPEDPYILAQLMELSSIEMTRDFSECMDDEFKVLTISVDMLIFDSASAIQDIKAINEKLAELFPDAQSCILGDMIEYAEMTNRMVWGELKSFLFSFVIIAIMLTIAFSSIRTGLIAMIPNVAPVILVGGFMGFSGYAMDFATMTTMPIILGIAVDDTIHLTTHLKLGLEKYGTYKGAMEASLREIGKSMFMSTLILCSIYAVYLLSPIRYLFVIGILSILGLSGALIADYTITPVLLYLVKPFGKERSN